ncbi:hypothetical protein Mag101_08430 [Microbulbifer agarilyticus]|uniref:Uncharacterized protein n=1 Tax=Microbulbifer agarilyticus TaxID=260552 RepID=A0A1Q2M4S4_9GAMM|nr:hypothetical protein [Microbulbifer agarilyticus]AQQ67660.1 hypothetical protein Mag101_08430 [Microbulbifer agarilyticus]
MRKLAVFLVAVLVSACANIPLGTMLKYSSFDIDDFLELNPAEISAKVEVEGGLELSDDGQRLAVTMETAKGERDFTFPLVIEEHGLEPKSDSWFGTSGPTNVYTLKLSGEGILAFEALQLAIRKEVPTGFGLKVSTRFKKMEEYPDENTVSILIRLAASESYVTLIDDAPLELEEST